MKKNTLGALLCALLLFLNGCAANAQPLATAKPSDTMPSPQATPNPSPKRSGDQSPSPTGTMSPNANSAITLPEKLKVDKNNMPSLDVYNIKTSKVENMPIEEYLCGVLAGEMKGDWPMEALKAQAILARTFVLKFVSEKDSKYPSADISTDIEEAQAYDTAGINERIRDAVEQTKGMILNAQGELPYAWFHAHSGGVTALAKEGLAYEKPEPSYTVIVKGMENSDADKDAANWSVSFPAANIMKAAQQLGISGNQLKTIQIDERGESGRAVTLLINGESVSAPAFRIALGSTEMKSTLLQSLKFENGKVSMKGKGYGHGVGMSQWGAYALAEQGETAEAIVTYYFRGVIVERLW